MIEQIIYWTIYLLFLHLLLQKKYKSFTITSNLVSLTHAVITIIGSSYFILTENWEQDNFNNKLWLIKISASYFIYDCLFIIINILINNNKSIIFLLHHLLILSVYYIALTYDYGAKLVIFTIFWGELTNPLQITWVLSRNLKYRKIEAYIFPVFSFNFMIIRSLVMPYMNYTIIKTLNNNYYYPNICLIILSILGNIGGFIWVKGIINKLIKLIK
jgi:hypothetical protein